MAEETITVTPKEMGSHLRAVRRRKGLSLSEVARGAGLNRRELVNYERGKAEIPESDMWVLAGSIGVDISELMPPATPVEAPSDNLPAVRHDPGIGSITDAVAMLRRGAEDDEASPLLGTLRMLQQLPDGKRVPLKDRQLADIAAQLGGSPAAIENQVATILGCDAQEAARVRAILLSAPQQGNGRRGRRAKAIAAAETEPAARYQAPVVPPPAASEPEPTERAAVDVFEELARLPEPLPLPEETSLPDIIATPPAPEGAVELVDHDTFPSLGERFGFKQPVMAESTATSASAAAGAAAAALRSGADAPPIDVTGRTDDWDWSGPRNDEPLARRPVPGDPPAADTMVHDGAPAGFDGEGWEPPAPEDGTVPEAFWEGTDDWAPAAEPTDDIIETIDASETTPVETIEMIEATDDAGSLWSFEPAAVDPWIAGGWPRSDTPEAAGTDELVDSEWPSAAFTPVEDTNAHPADIWGDDDGLEVGGDEAPVGYVAPELVTPDPVMHFGTPEATADLGTASWTHDPDPSAVDSGFMVDWGDADDAEPDEQPEEPVAGQWAGTGDWDEPLTPAWEVHTPVSVDGDDEGDATTAGAHETFDVYDAFAADPFAAATEAATETTDIDGTAGTVDTETAETVETVETTTSDSDLHAFSFGSELAAALAATYLPDGSEEPELFAPEGTGTFTDFAPVEVEAIEAGEADISAEAIEAVATFEAGATFEADEPEAADPAAFEPEVSEPEPYGAELETSTFEPDTIEAESVEPGTFAADAVDAEGVEVEHFGAEHFEAENFEAEPATLVEELPRIAWRADASGNVDAVADDTTESDTSDPEAEPEPEPEAIDAEPFTEVFVTAGPDWQLGNAVPLVEVRSEGALVMRRADERWALADVTATDDFSLEVDVDFRSGPGLGLLFRASVDEQGRMSGYSFDIDPIYDGGGFLVRQWQDDRELWNPIARVAAADPNAMYGKLTVRLEVHGETLVAFVNGAEVMTVDDLAQASVERGRAAARGDRVGVQAWSSSDLVIDTLRVAAR
jgi:transcriptional regulator with XRE-family HTH domain